MALAATACTALVGNGFRDVSVTGPPEATEAGSNQAPLDGRCQVYGGDAGSPILIGAILPMTVADAGTPNPTGVYRLESIRTAFDQLNPPNRAGINGRPLGLIVCDNSGDSTQAAPLAQSLVQARVPAIIGATSADILQEATVTVPNRVLLISSSATAAEISSLAANDSATGVRLVWRTAPPDSFQGAVLAHLISDGLPDAEVPAPGDPDGGMAGPVGVFEVNNAYGQGLVAALQSDYSGSATNVGLYTENGDVSGALKTVAMATPAPTLIVAIAFPADAVALINGAASYPSLASLRWIFTDSAQSPALFTGLKDPGALAGALGTAPAPAPASSPAYLWFKTQFQATYSEDPTNAGFTANTFDAAMLLALSASWATGGGRTLDGPTMATALTKVSSAMAMQTPLDPVEFDTLTAALAAGQPVNIEGASGALDFDASTGEAPAPIEIWQVADGGFTTLAVEQP
jgi:branched-chain amino acid transport system substrate-binding protein